MCGIVGIVSNDNSLRVTIEALKRLEYRGYDSFGVSVLLPTEIFTKKSIGSVNEHDANAFFDDVPKASITIAHTRWATHGGVTVNNAHPHQSYDGHFSLVHNGVIENYLQIRQELQEQGIECQSETDTEIIVHLLAKNYAATADVLSAIEKTVDQLVGEYAFTFMTNHDRECIYAARNKSPLVFGMTAHLAIIASDQTAVAPLTKTMTFAQEGDIIKASSRSVTCYTRKNGQLIAVEREKTHVPWINEAIDKQGYPHYMIKEIYEAIPAIENAIKLRKIDLEPIVDDIVNHQLSITGAGSAFYVSQLGQYYFASLAKKYAYVHPADEFLNLVTLGSDDHLITISQSGETFDTLEVMRSAKKNGVPITSINNVFGSTSQRLATYPIFQGAGTEVCVLTTKAIISQAVILYLLATLMGARKGILEPSVMNQLITELHQLPNLLQTIFNDIQAKIKTVAEKHQAITNWFFIGRWIYYPVAMESALKLKEVSYRHAEGMPAGFLKHGTISLIDENFYTIAFLPNEKTAPEIFHFTMSNISEIQARGGKVIAFGHETESHKDIIKLHDYVKLPSINKYLDPILHLIAGQLLAYHYAVSLGREIDKPRALAKSVTVR
jgi:glucosamine--fructose-6-phosphate aminotransferase (isomerizing)